MINFDYSKLRGKIKETFGNDRGFANALNISPVSLSGKLNNRVGFSQSEIDTSIQMFDLKGDEVLEYFFSKKS